MPKLTAKERAELEARLAEDDDDSADDEVTISSEGRTFTGTWRRVQQVAEAWGFPLAKPAEEADPKDEGKSGVTKFGRRVS